MYKQVFFLLIVVLHLAAFYWFSAKKKNAWFLLVSFYVIGVPLRMHLYLDGPEFITPAGTFGNVMFIPLTFAVFLIFFIIHIQKIKSSHLRLHPFNWPYFIILLGVISLMNPFNVARYTTGIFLIFFLSHIMFLRLLYILTKPEDVLKGLYAGLAFITIVHFITSMLFPLLNYEPALSFFDITGTEGATRLGTRSGAIGMFNHPNTLGVFTGMCIAFFLSCWLRKYRARLSLMAMGVNAVTLLLTYSRTSYLVLLAIVFLLIYINKYPQKPLVSVENLVKFVLPFVLVLGWFIFLSPFSAMFLESDVDEQVGNRQMHFTMAVEAFKASPFIGVGINTHLEFFKENFFLISYLGLNEFFYENHIHNIHLIMLAEAGGIGFLLWLCFLLANIGRAKRQLALKQHDMKRDIFSLTQIGFIAIYFINGFTDWAPFSNGVLPLFLLVNYFSIKYRRKEKASLAFRKRLSAPSGTIGMAAING